MVKGNLTMPSYRFGKHPVKHDYRTLRFKTYLSKDLLPPPASYDSLGRVYSQLNVSDPTKLFPLDGNDFFGDCTIAARNGGVLSAMADCVAVVTLRYFYHLLFWLHQ